MAGRGYVLVVSLHPQDVFTTLFFTNGFGQPHPIRVVQYRHGDMGAALAGASAVILVRGLFEFADLAACAKAMQVPAFYFVDDNFMVLRDLPGVHSRFVERYSVENVRDALRGFTGVLLSSPALLSYFAANRLHPQLHWFPPMEGPPVAVTRPAEDTGVRIAFFGGQHLHAMFNEMVLPAIRRLATDVPVSLTAIGAPAGMANSPGLSLKARPYEPEYRRAVTAMRAEGIDILVHPGLAGFENNQFKNPHALITANALGAVPVVSMVPPYEALASEGVALFCEASEGSWYAALRQAATAAGRVPVLERLARYCATHFDGHQNHGVMATLLAQHRPPSSWVTCRRMAIAAGCGTTRLLTRISSRLTRSAAGLGAAGA